MSLSHLYSSSACAAHSKTQESPSTCYAKRVEDIADTPNMARHDRRRTAAAAFVLLAFGIARLAHATVYTLAKSDDSIVGEDQTIITVYQDTLYDLARHYSLGSEELIRVNPGIDPWIPGVGKNIIVPGRVILPSGPRTGIVVNLPEHRIYYFPKAKRGQPQQVITFPVS